MSSIRPPNSTPNTPDSLVAQTIVAVLIDWDLPASHAHTARALEGFPNNLAALGWHGSNLLFLRRFDEAEKALIKALDVDPLSLATIRTLGDLYMASGRRDLAIETYQRALNLVPDTGRINGRIARCKLFQDDIAAAKTYNAKEPVTWVRETNDLIFLGREGPLEDWQTAVLDYEAEYGFGNSYQMAEVYADKGDLDKAFEWLDHTARVKDPGGPWALVMPFFDEAKKDPRWRDYEAKFGL